MYCRGTGPEEPITEIAVPSTLEPEPAPTWKRVVRILIWLVAVALLFFVLNAAGISVWSWLKSLWDTLKEISVGYIIAGCFFQTIQTSLTAFAWFAILRAAYPGKVTYRPVLASYAVSVAMNGVLPANIGTFVLLFMLVIIIPGATFAGIFAGYLVEKIFFTVIGAVVYLYLFLKVGGSFSIQLGNVSNHVALTILIVAGAVVLIAMVVRICWRWVKKLWAQAKQGGAILAYPRKYFLEVFVPSFGSWLAKLCVIGIFLAAYGIPVTFYTIMTIVGGNSLANVTSVTPGGVGVNQAINTASLAGQGVDPTTATAYSTAQQLITTAWNIGFAIVLVAVVFGWSGGKQLVGTSYTQAKEKSKEMQEERKEKRAVKKEEKRQEKETREAEKRATRDGEAGPD
ncbi:MAG TPA: lysylphosphatidylglycerol synthase transmembrane domain-containing protein [Gaiellaceae bacterium]|jgi:uncharacterized membrane protein YbhN (UPF0104 family)